MASSSGVKRPRGNPNFLLKRAQREGVDVSELIQMHLRVRPRVVLKPHEVAHLIDKNSRTMSKMLQLMEIVQQSPGGASLDTQKHLNKRIEFLRKRINRRLIRLAKWSDIPQEERQPKDRSSARAGGPAAPGAPFGAFPPMAPVGWNPASAGGAALHQSPQGAGYAGGRPGLFDSAHHSVAQYQQAAVQHAAATIRGSR